MSDRKEYVVTLKDANDLDGFYLDMENGNTLPTIPTRSVECSARRPNSRNTNYLLTKGEAELLRMDPRVESVDLHHSLKGIKGGAFTYNTGTFNVTQDPNPMRFDKSAGQGSIYVNWGALRTSNGYQTPGWGNNNVVSQTVTLKFEPIGRNVDVVVVDGGNPDPTHPEYAVNYDGTGGSRMSTFDWYSLDPIVKGTPEGAPYVGWPTLTDPHAFHTSGIVAGNRQGFARGANIYNLYYDAGSSFTYAFDYVMQYVKAFHETKPANTVTGIKNPTIVNNSWGMSIFPGDWSFDDITAVTYRGVRHEPTTNPGGFSGVCNSSSSLANINSNNSTGNRITTSGSNATVTSITYGIHGTSGLTMISTPTVGTNDDGYWQISLPFNISYLGTTYNTIYANTNWYVSFGGGSTSFVVNAASPAYPKICMSGDDHATQKIYHGVVGTSPNRIYVVRFEASNLYSSVTSDAFFEYWFYESTPNRIDLQIDTNSSIALRFTEEQLNGWGFIRDQRIPMRVPALDADIIDAMDAGVIMVGAAGNGQWYHDVPGGLDWDNTFEMDNRYPGEIYHYMRGSSPTANDINMLNICVGAISRTDIDQKAYFSDCGPGVDIWAPGYSIQSAYYGAGATDQRNISYKLAKISGTSMAAPQVCGVLASYLELYPRWTQADAKHFVTTSSKQDQIYSTNGGYTDTTDLQGSPNLMLYFPRLLPSTGLVGPSVPYGERPVTGQAWPRPRIFRYGSY